MNIIAALDPGSRHCGLFAAPLDLSRFTMRYVPVEDDIAPAVDAIVEWVVSTGAEVLAIELGPFYPRKPSPWVLADPEKLKKHLGAESARSKQYGIMDKLVDRVKVRCAALKPPIETRVTPRNTWCKRIGALADRDIDGNSKGVNDKSAHEAVCRQFAARGLVPPRFGTVHEMDACGLFLGAVIGKPERTGKRGGEGELQLFQKRAREARIAGGCLCDGIRKGRHDRACPMHVPKVNPKTPPRFSPAQRAAAGCKCALRGRHAQACPLAGTGRAAPPAASVGPQ